MFLPAQTSQSSAWNTTIIKECIQVNFHDLGLGNDAPHGIMIWYFNRVKHLHISYLTSSLQQFNRGHIITVLHFQRILVSERLTCAHNIMARTQMICSSVLHAVDHFISENWQLGAGTIWLRECQFMRRKTDVFYVLQKSNPPFKLCCFKNRKFCSIYFLEFFMNCFFKLT